MQKLNGKNRTTFLRDRTSPSWPVETPRIGAIKPTDRFEDKGRDFEYTMSLCAPVNPLGHCAMSVPSGFSAESGMPVGSMIHAPDGFDERLYGLALELEEARPWRYQWAPNSVRFVTH